jgi:phosphatidylserine decarboxylase
MYIHKEGYLTILITFLVSLALSAIVFYIFHKTLPSVKWFSYLLYTGIAVLFCHVFYFFRVSERHFVEKENIVLAVADGTICIIEEVEEPEYFKDKRLQVSIFMSAYNQHVNRYPISGNIAYYKYHPGKHIVAFRPKSSVLNEHTSIVIENERACLLIRQIAGFVARRIVCYTEENQQVHQTDELGFIKFGSRIDYFLPLGTQLKVKLGDKVKSGISEIAEW